MPRCGLAFLLAASSTMTQRNFLARLFARQKLLIRREEDGFARRHTRGVRGHRGGGGEGEKEET